MRKPLSATSPAILALGALLIWASLMRSASAGQTGFNPSPLAFISGLVAESGASVRSSIAYGPASRHQLDVYEPEPGRPRRSTIIVFYYGGGWVSGDRGLYAFLGSAFASRGYTTVIADYRLYPQVQFPVFVEDAALAYGWVARTIAGGATSARSRRPDNSSRRPIVVMGHSAGAHIGALIALDPRYRAQFAPEAPAPAGFIGLAGPYAFDPTSWPTTKDIFAPAIGNPDATRPTVQAAKLKAPLSALLLHGSDDTVVTPDASTQFAQALVARGANVQHVSYGVGHLGVMLAYARPLRWRAGVLDRTLAFLDHIEAGDHSRLEPTRSNPQRATPPS